MGATAWVAQNMGALLTDRVGEVLRALKRMRPWKQAIREADRAYERVRQWLATRA